MNNQVADFLSIYTLVHNVKDWTNFSLENNTKLNILDDKLFEDIAKHLNLVIHEEIPKYNGIPLGSIYRWYEYNELLVVNHKYI